MPTPTAAAMAAHLCVIQPAGCKAALAGLEAALCLRAQLQEIGVATSLAKNRLRPEALNFVFGVSWGFDTEAARGHRVVLVNTHANELAEARLPPQALRLLGRYPVLEPDLALVRHYRPEHQPSPQGDGTAKNACLAAGISSGNASLADVFPWWPAPPATATLAPIAARPIELLLASSPNPRQATALQSLERWGLNIARLESPLYGPELAALASQARALLLLLPHDGAQPDAAAISLALAAGTPVLAERPAGTPVLAERPAGSSSPAQDALQGVAPEASGLAWPAAAAAIWFELNQASLRAALSGPVRSAEFAGQAEAALQAGLWQRRAECRAAAEQLWAWASQLPAPPQPYRAAPRLNADMARFGYLPGWLNLSADAAQQPDIQPDLQPNHPPDALLAPSSPAVGTFEQILLGGELDLRLGPPSPQALDQALAWLAEGGRLVLHWPLEAAIGNLPALATCQAQIEQQLMPWTDAFWQRQAFSHRLQLAHIGWLDAAGRPCACATLSATINATIGATIGATHTDPGPPDDARATLAARPAVCARIVLQKRETSYRERTQARAAREDFGLGTG